MAIYGDCPRMIEEERGAVLIYCSVESGIVIPKAALLLHLSSRLALVWPLHAIPQLLSAATPQGSEHHRTSDVE